MIRILHLEDSNEDAELIHHRIRTRWPDARITRVQTRTAFESQLHKDDQDFIISDYHLPDFTDLDALNLAQKERPDLPFIFCSGTIGEERAIDAMRAGATDYVLKEKLNRLIPALERVEREVTDRRGRHAAEETVHLLLALLENTTDLVFVCDPQGECVYINPAGRRLLSLDPAAAPNFIDIVPEELRAQYREEILPRVREEGIWTGEFEIVAQVARRIAVSQVIVAHRDRSRTFTHFSAIVRDMTETHQANQTLQEQTEAITQARDGIAIMDTRGRLTFWNKGAETILGWTQDETIRKEASDFLGYAADFAASTEDAHPGGSSAAKKEIVVDHRDGRRVTLELRIHAIADGDGKPKAKLLTFTDLTVQKSLQEQLLRAQRLESLGLLASGISHDLNNILAPILMAAPLLRRQVADSSGESLIDMLERSAQRGAELVQQILSFARGVSGEAHLLQLKHVLREVCTIVERTFPKSVEVIHEFEQDLPAVEANATQMHQLILNLCVNARDAMPEGGTLSIRAFPVRGGDLQLAIEVSDTGMGIPKEVQDRMWEPFFTTKEPGKSTGLGLSTVRGIVQSHQGQISVKSEVGRGTTFRVTLPAISLTDGDERSGRSDLPRGNDELVLVIDDEKPIADTVSALLRSYGYRTLVALEATAAIELAAHHAAKIRLVLTDYSMPQIDGSALTGVFKKLIPDAKVIISSGHLSPVAFSGKSYPPDRFITKPYTENVLIKAIHDLLHREGHPPEAH